MDIPNFSIILEKLLKKVFKMSKLQAPRGCHDLLPEDCALSEAILIKAQKWAHIYGFKTYKTPIFENSEVFTKTLGDTSDIITKEMYSFNDQNDNLFILRPEATAPLVRLFISKKLQRSAPLKMFTYGPMFRYERPQKGRHRQFHQIGIEYIGAPKDLFTHFEVISMGWNFVNSLNIQPPLKIKVNSIGSHEERKIFKEKLVKYLTPLKNKLSKDSQKRILNNPLRILDDKSEQDRSLLADAPKIIDYISEKARKELFHLINLCKLENITIEHDPFLVRGLDYYNDLVFEIICEGELGAQNTILAGGRYDNLVASMGGGHHPAMGWGAGLERLMLLSKIRPKIISPIGLVLQNSNEILLSQVSNELRLKNIPTFIPTTGNFSKKLLKCQKAGCEKVIIIGTNEINSGNWTIKNFKTGSQQTFPKANFFKLFN